MVVRFGAVAHSIASRHHASPPAARPASGLALPSGESFHTRTTRCNGERRDKAFSAVMMNHLGTGVLNSQMPAVSVRCVTQLHRRWRRWL